MKATLLIDPARLSTAQQKLISFRQRRVFTNPRVAAGMRLVEAAARPFAKQAQDIERNAPYGAVALSVAFYFRFPKTGTKAQKAARRGGLPVVSAKWGDLDNRAKSFIDALVKARWFTDDHIITTLLLRKRYTLSQPRAEVEVLPDISWQLGEDVLKMGDEDLTGENSPAAPQ